MVQRTPVHRPTLAILILAVSVLLNACMGTPVALNGTITDAYTGNPVPNATLKLGSQSATTDAAGKYQIPSFRRTDALEASAAGYETLNVALESQPQLEKPAPPAATLDAKLRPNTLSGTITNSYTGEPVAGAQVQASETVSATTGADGRYTLAGVPESFALTVTAPDHEPATQQVERRIALDAEVRPNVVTGTVTDAETGDPVAGATVKAGSATTTTGDDGAYRLDEVPAGAEVEISAPGYAAVSTALEQQTALDATLESNVLTGVVTDQYTNEPIKGATVKAGEATTTTGDDGTYRLEGATKNTEVEISADGYAAVTKQIAKLEPFDAALRPDVLGGQLVDAETDEPIKNATVIATETLTGTDVAFARIDNSTDGSYKLDGIPEQGYIQVLAPGYKKAVVEIKTGEVPPSIELEPFTVKASYITAAVASAGLDLVNEYYDMIDRTELNAIVIDLKSDMRDDLGLVYYLSDTPMVKELDTAADFVDMRALIAEAKRRGIYTIARVQLFSHDNALADARPDWTIIDRKTGKTYADLPGPGIRYAWLDPFNRNVWKYNIDLSVEAAQMGFDEINLDYIRYPDWGDLETYKDKYQFSQPADPANDGEAMYQNIADFMKEAHRAINGAGAFMSIDVFGRVVIKPSLPIAQDIARMAPHTDYIAPMPYPSLWWPTYLGFDNPTAHPYEVILGSLKTAAPHFDGKRALLRPWLQDHTDPWQGSRVVEYGPKEVRAQIDATHDSGVANGWMLYDSANTYTEGALRRE